jgi:transcriptional regulator with XRE-family HTH domain
MLQPPFTGPDGTFADRLTWLQENVKVNGIPQSDKTVAEAAGVTPAYIGQLRKGQRVNPARQLVAKIEAHFQAGDALSVADRWTSRAAPLSPGSVELVTDLIDRLTRMPAARRSPLTKTSRRQRRDRTPSSWAPRAQHLSVAAIWFVCQTIEWLRDLDTAPTDENPTGDDHTEAEPLV